ncbi:GntR family transcriptional regulator [Microbacterium arabinogalactanolyticum]|uniref:GntR family transcriptional regulator n=1 Tax=Microbacterium arabinogalactanolyticum TaxID=69365 RepID=UPI0040442600
MTESGSRPVALNYRSKTDLVTDYIRAELQSGRIGAGERLVVSRVADELGVSKVPVREAVTRLVGEGLLILRPNVGPVVPIFSEHEVIETALMRAAIEGLALEYALPHHDERSIAHADEILQRMADPEQDFPALNVEFHLALIAPSPYEEITRTAATLLERAHRFLTVHRVPGYRSDAEHEHAQLLELVRQGDLEGLQILNREHIMAASRKLMEQMSPADGTAQTDGDAALS